MTSSGFNRRHFIRTGAGAAASVVARSAEADPLEGCSAPLAPPPVPADAGVAYGERFRGVLLGQDFELSLELEIPQLVAFLAGPHVARVTGGFVKSGETAALPVTAGSAQFFQPCPDGAEFRLEFTYADAQGRVISGRGVRTLGPSQRRDPAAELSELSLTLSANTTPIASGTLQSSVEQTLEQLLSVRALRTGELASGEVRDAFLEFMNRGCNGVHPELPFIVDTGIALPAAERRALTLAATVMLPERLPAGGPSVCQAIQQLSTFLGNSDQAALAALRVQLSALGRAAPFLTGLIGEIRSFVKDVLESEKESPFRAILDSIHKVAVLGYYSHPAADALVGYRRPSFAPLYHTRLPVREHPTPRVFDVVIVGAGVAGSLLAERLSAQNKSVLLVEQGPYVSESDITSDEALWIARLQKNSGLQRANLEGPLSSSVGNVVVLQGACVGGGGMINNAVCFMLPERRLEQWRGLGFPIEPSDLRQSFLAVARELDIGPISEKTANPNPVCRLLENTFGKPRIPKVGVPLAPGFYECLVNLAPRRCLGCGMCNTGCGSERKRNALQVHLPRALAGDRDAELLADTEVVEILVRKKAGLAALEVEGLSLRTPRGALRVQAREYVLSAGAVGTNALMLRSSGFRYATQSLPIGKRFSANVVSPVVSFYDDLIVNPRPTLQLTHYYVPPGADDGFLLESMNDPPGQMALLMPGYGERHHQRMLRFKSTALMGIAIGTLPNGEVTLDDAGRAKISMPLGENEHRRMKAAFDVLLRALFRGGAGKAPVEVVAGMLGGGFAMRSESDVDAFGSWFKTISRVILSTGHPMGGSAMSADPRLSVVGRDFRVRGFSNLRVCDASLFPMAAGVNPQWTVLALADRCGHVMNNGG